MSTSNDLGNTQPRSQSLNLMLPPKKPERSFTYRFLFFISCLENVSESAGLACVCALDR